MKKNIILTGTHGSGKTTIVESYRNNDNYVVFNEMIRILSQADQFQFYIDENSTREDIIKYFFSEAQLTEYYYSCFLVRDKLRVGEFKDKIFLYDRFLVDPLYYTNYFMTKYKSTLSKEDYRIISETYQYAMARFSNYYGNHWLDDFLFILLKPLPLDISDEFRLAGEKCQQDVFDIAKQTLNIFKIEYLELSAEDIRKNGLEFYNRNKC